MKNMKKKIDKNLNTISIVYFFISPRVYRKKLHIQVLSIQVFSSGGHYGLRVSADEHYTDDQFKPIVVNYNEQ